MWNNNYVKVGKDSVLYLYTEIHEKKSPDKSLRPRPKTLYTTQNCANERFRKLSQIEVVVVSFTFHTNDMKIGV